MDIRTLSLEDDADRQSWDTLVRVSPQRNPYASPEYVQAFGEAFDYEPEIVGLFRDNYLIGGTVLYLERKGPYRRVTIPPFTQYTSVLLEEPPPVAAIHARNSPLDALLYHVEDQYASLQIALHPSLQDVRSFQWHNWEVFPRYTYMLELKDRERLLRDWSAGTRRLFLKHESEFEVIEAPWASRAIIDLAVQSYTRHACSFPTDPKRLDRAVRRLVDTHFARAFIARRREEPEAGLIILHDRKTAYYWIAGSRPGSAMTVLLGSVLPRLYAETIDRFDFVGANTPSIAEFKRRFGPELRLYFIATRINRPELRMLATLKR